MLSCSCDYEFEWYYYIPDDFTKFKATRRKRCVSCNILINTGADCLEFECYRDPYNDIEEKIYGDEVPIACKYLCDKCAEIFLNLTDIGYCVSLGDTLKEDLADYWDITGFKPGSQVVPISVPKEG